jgi:hypothetical protein
MRKALRYAVAVALTGAFAASGSAQQADRMDWSKVPASELTLFYPGQASLQYLEGPDHAGGKAVQTGMACNVCHKETEARMGNAIAAGHRLEPRPITGKPGTVKVTVQAAYDAENLYFRFSWPTRQPGMFHEYLRYRDGKWQVYASQRANPHVASGKLKASYEDRFAIMLGEAKSVARFAEQGCFVTCHNDLRYMPDEAKKGDVQAHPALGDRGMRKTDIRKYLAITRTGMGPSGGWDKLKPKGEIAALKEKGAFLELWQWRAYRSNPVAAADDGYVLEYRNFDAGRNPFFNNWDGAKNQPRFMFDPAKNSGRAGLTPAQFRDPEAPILSAANRLPYDPALMKAGELLPRFGLDTPEGSAADNRPVKGTYADGRWTLFWTRKLDTGSKDDVALKPGQSYPIGFSVHEDNVTARFHHVTFPMTLSLGGEGTVRAVSLR